MRTIEKQNKYIALIRGEPKSGFCGVNDYSIKLLNALVNLGVKCNDSPLQNMSLREFISILPIIRSSECKLSIIQYPCSPYKSSLIPFFLALLSRSPVLFVAHEYSDSHFLRKAAIRFISFKHNLYYLFLQESDKVRYLNDKYLISSNKILQPIPIGPNITISKIDTWLSMDDSISYYGLIRPNKGIEEFIDFCKYAQTITKKYKFRIYGGYIDGKKSYLDEILSLCKALGIEVFLNKSEPELSNLLGRDKFFYLCFPDGISMRRGSALTLLSGSGILFAKLSKSTEPHLIPLIEPISTNYAANLARIEQLNKENGLTIPQHISRTAFIQGLSWSEIAKKYLNLIK